MIGAEAVPWHRRLLVRLLAGALVIASVAIAATAWLAAQTTRDALRRATAPAGYRLQLLS